MRGEAWLVLEDDDKALADFDAAIRLDPQPARAHANRGSIWGRRGEIDKALSDLNEAIRLDPSRSQPYTDRGAAWATRASTTSAWPTWMKRSGSIPITPAPIPIGHHLLARLGPTRRCRTSTRPSASIPGMRRPTTIAPASGSTRRNMTRRSPTWTRQSGWIRARPAAHQPGSAWEKKGRYDKALADFNEAIRLDPRDGWNHNNRAWLLATCPEARYRDGRQAVASATHACELAGWKQAYLIGTLAAAYAEAGDFDAAIKWQTRANAMYSDAKDRSNGEARLELYRAKRPITRTGPDRGLERRGGRSHAASDGGRGGVDSRPGDDRPGRRSAGG